MMHGSRARIAASMGTRVARSAWAHRFGILFLPALLSLSGLHVPAQMTEVPETVEPARVLLEMDALSLSYRRSEPGGGTATGLAVASTMLTVGLTPRIDVQVGADLFLSQKIETGGASERHSGIGDMMLRAKWNFWEIESALAAAVIPFCRFPTGAKSVGSRKAEGGVIVPWAATLGEAGRLLAMMELDILHDGSGSGHHASWSSSVAWEGTLARGLGLYGEASAGKESGGLPWRNSVGAGMTFDGIAGGQWDVAVYRGLSRGSADWNPVVRYNRFF